MRGRYPQVKTSIIKWRDENKDKYNEYQRAIMKRKYIMQKAQKELFAILLD
jgi:hypothetical protein